MGMRSRKTTAASVTRPSTPAAISLRKSIVRGRPACQRMKGKISSEKTMKAISQNHQRRIQRASGSAGAATAGARPLWNR